MCLCPQKIQVDPVRPGTQGRATRAPALRQAADGRTQIRCAGHVSATQACQVGKSQLKATNVATTLAIVASLQPSNRQLEAS
jgi:hypothetical protein